jgi:hypothetical protein
MTQSCLKIKVNWHKVIEVGDGQKVAKIRKNKIMVNSPQINLMSNRSKKKMKKSRVKGVQKGQKIRKKIYLMIKLHTNQISIPSLRSYSSIDHFNKSTKG